MKCKTVLREKALQSELYFGNLPYYRCSHSRSILYQFEAAFMARDPVDVKVNCACLRTLYVYETVFFSLVLIYTCLYCSNAAISQLYYNP